MLKTMEEVGMIGCCTITRVRARALKMTALALGVSLFFPLGAAYATNYVWSGEASGNWMDTAKWSPTPAAADFNDTNHTFAILTGGDVAVVDGGTFGADLFIHAGAKLKVSVSGTASNIYLCGGIIAYGAWDTVMTLSGENIYVQSNSVLQAGDGTPFYQNLVIEHKLNGTNALQKTNTARVYLSGNSTNYGGTITVSAGRLYSSHTNSFGTNCVEVINGGGVEPGAGIGRAVVNVNPGGTIYLITTDNLSILAG